MATKRHGDSQQTGGGRRGADTQKNKQGADAQQGADPGAPVSMVPVVLNSEMREEADVHEKAAASARVVYRAILEEAGDELKRPVSALWWSGLAAGLSMGFSLVSEGLLRSHLPDTSWRPLVSKFGYSIGFLIVVLGRQQLFTENTLTPVLSFLKHKTLKELGRVGRLWGIVLVANLVGTWAFALVLAKTTAFDPEVKSAFLAIARDSLKLSFGTVVLRGIFAGWLIALMVWLLPVAEVARVWVIILVTYIIGLGPSCHVIAGSVDTMFAVWMGQFAFGQYITGFLIPALIGNIIGGVSLVAALNHAQVTAGSGE